MSSPHMTVVMTTIALPRVLESYASNAAQFGRTGDVDAIVIGDCKTPAESAEYVGHLRSQWGFRAEYVDIDAQKRWLQPWPDVAAMVPYNSDNRRNVGFLMALEHGCDILLSIDDDNYCTAEDFYQGHAHAGQTVRGPVIRSSTGWFNICSLMQNDAGLEIFPRGFPVGKRGQAAVVSSETRECFVAANAGLWLDDPDLDAVTRLYRDVKTTAVTGGPVLLGPDSHSPINTQNTAVVRGAVCAYYYVVMNEDLGGFKIDRYGDIWSGYFLKKCADHLGHYCRVGTPVARHARNRHDLFLDLRQELQGMMLTDPLVEILASIPLQGSDYARACEDLSRRLEQAVTASPHPYMSGAVKAYFRKICANMRTWVDVCKALS